MRPPLDEIDAITVRVTGAVRALVREEIEQVRQPAPIVTMPEMDREILAASTKVAFASDRLAQVKYTPGEAAARKQLEARAAHLHKVMKKWGRVVE